MGDLALPDQGPGLDGAFVATHGIDSLTPELGPLLVAVGVFDGIHRGHLYLLRHLRNAARHRGARPTVITFDAHPREIITGAAPTQLCDAEERLVRLAAAGVEVTVVQHFDDRLRHTSYDAFVAMIRERANLLGFLMTPDAAFGHERRGTPETLAALGAQLGFEVDVVPSLSVDGRAVSSSEIRRAVTDGDLGLARYLLGRSLSVVGERLDQPGQAAAGDVPLAFPVPVALPPAGRYGVTVGRPWTLGEVPEGAAIRAIADVSGDPQRVELRSMTAPLGPGRRLRVVFQRRLNGAAEPGSVAGSGQA